MKQTEALRQDEVTPPQDRVKRIGAEGKRVAVKTVLRGEAGWIAC